MYKIYFPLFDHHESRTNEVRLTHEGLLAHPQVTLVDRPELADYLIFCQNHLVDHCPLHRQFRSIKDRYKEQTILLDYDDNPHTVFDAADFRWRLYFKRSCVDRRTGQVMRYPGLRIIPTAYAVMEDMVAPPPDHDRPRRLDLACLFDDSVTSAEPYKHGRGRLLQFARQLATTHPGAMQIGPVSSTNTAGRSAIHPAYKRCLYDSRIVLHANPDWWEGDSRTWEALASGALLFVDRIHAPIAHPLIDGEHLVFYDFTVAGMAALEARIIHFLGCEPERAAIASRGRDFVLTHHRSIDRVNAIVAELSATAAQTAPRTSGGRAVAVIVTDEDQTRAVPTRAANRGSAPLIGSRLTAPAAFIPFSIEVIRGRSVVRWIECGRAPTTLPFFAQMIKEQLASGAGQRVTGLDALHASTGPDPAGLVMHLSRSGATLVMQSLAQAGCVAPISEAAPVNQLLARGDIDQRERALLLRGLLRALGVQDAAPIALPSIVRLTSWNVLFLDVIRAAFPQAPWLFLYREPLDVLASHDQLPARWLADEPFLAGVADTQRLPSLAGLAREQRCAAVLAAYGRAVLAASPAACNLLNYSQLPAALSADVPARFGIATTTPQQCRIAEAGRICSMEVSRRRVLDTDRARRRRGVSPEARQAADLRYSRSVHVALERCRTAGRDDTDDASGSQRAVAEAAPSS
jgi:glycosyl transferase family 1